jgi:hypothetical protein
VFYMYVGPGPRRMAAGRLPAAGPSTPPDGRNEEGWPKRAFC